MVEKTSDASSKTKAAEQPGGSEQARTTHAAGPGTPGGQQRGGGHQQRGRRPRQRSRYGTQMEEKQNLKKIYGIKEEQLRRYYTEAQRSNEETGKKLITLLEHRLDNALYRAGFAETRPAARQMASHRLVEVNGRPVTIPSLRLQSGDTVTVKESKRKKGLFANFEKRMQNVAPPAWLSLDGGAFSFSITSEADPEEAGLGIDVRAIVEYFAR